MLVKNIRNVMASVAGVAMATSALGEGTAVKTGGSDATLYGEFRTELTHDDDGLVKIDSGAKQSKTTVLGVEEVKAGLKGKFNDRTSYNFRLNFADGASVEHAHATWKATDMFAVTMGKDYVRQGGFSNADNEFNNVWGNRAQYAAFDRYAESLSLHIMPGGSHNVTVQLVNDVMPDDAATADVVEGMASYNTTHKQPAAILEYTGEFGGISPIVQYGSYDLNHSKFFDVGLRAKFGATGLTFDYGVTTVAYKSLKDKTASYNNITLRAEHDLGSAKPFVWYNSFNRTDKDLGTEEVKTNTSTANWDDNANQISVGAFLPMGANWNPYVAYRMKSGKFENAAGEEKTGSMSQLAIGATGEF
ncbi:MAG: hypothetical protein RIQ81_1232 [Pseudomonadota bacterium]